MKIGNHTVKSEELLLRFEKVEWEKMEKDKLIRLCQNLIGELDCAYENFHVTHQAYVKADGQIRAMQVGLYEI